MRMKATRLPMKTYISVLSNTNIVSKGLEIMGDPMRKEVGMVRKKIEMANREIKSLSQSCQKKEREYKEIHEAFDEKNKEKAHLVSILMELLAESERVRVKKLEEINKTIGSLR
ncbi:RAB6-interacting golgin (DUF662) [Arabidopsis thaliana]|uniref:RAB6-interacting golgin (DUF662) n=1 Tax=Arabidopsis thaliana TaxID=3702 RepID=B3H4H5_ARATH|nr:RAB6-interacting golgin (DUF662) [Arabidopsis thaliana]AEC09238.1 RAB6-interacting golgin (DUF662) [Arabidopsis thaliana]|eukprot:NP_001118452.1 RAB6-interacting golgin (DUF662) [Arabidopsis thaliana]